MKSLKEYLRENCKDLVEHLKAMEQKKVESVYTEKQRPDNAVRVWISYDIDHDDDYSRHELLYKWLSTMCAESWGNSVASFVWHIEQEPTNENIANWIVDELTKIHLLEGTSFEDVKWKLSKDISLYVIYRYKVSVNKEDKYNSNHFVLVQNAEITHKGGF